MSVKHMREIERKNILIDNLHNEIERLKHANRTVSSMVSAEHYQELKDDRDRLHEELLDWVTQFGCQCMHPSCTTCRMTHDAYKALYPNKKTFGEFCMKDLRPLFIACAISGVIVITIGVLIYENVR